MVFCLPRFTDTLPWWLHLTQEHRTTESQAAMCDCAHSNTRSLSPRSGRVRGPEQRELWVHRMWPGPICLRHGSMVMPRQPFLTVYGRVSPLEPPALEQSILGSRDHHYQWTWWVWAPRSSSTRSQDLLMLLEGSTAGNPAKGL